MTEAPDPEGAPGTAPEAEAQQAEARASEAQRAGARGGGAARARRWTVGVLAAAHAAALGWAAVALPWKSFTLFSAATAIIAALHAATAALSLAPHALAPRAWRIASFGSLAYLGYLTFSVARSAVYVASLNRGLGSGIAAALGAAWAAAALLTLPFACWGIAATGGLRARRGGVGAALALIVASALAREAWVARADAAPLPGGSPERAAAAIRGALPAPASLPAPEEPASLFTRAPAECAAAPGAGRATVVVTHLGARGEGRPGRPGAPAVDQGRAGPVTRCLQAAPGEDVGAAIGAALAEGARGPAKIDVISAVQPLRTPGAALSGLALRPGLDGICLVAGATGAGPRARCLMPWQLVALDAFNDSSPLPGVPDFRFGVSLERLRKALGEERPAASTGFGAQGAVGEGLLRIETLSYVADEQGELRPLSRLGRPDHALDAGAVMAAARAAQAYIVASQRGDGMFRYLVDPFSGRASFEGFSIARQAGTTLALCELGEPEDVVRPVIRRSLSMLARLERRAGGGGELPPLGALVYPRASREPVAALNPTALSLIALLSCRPIVGPDHDALIGRLARMVLGTQREDGGFAPRYDLAARAAVPGPGQLYEGGQAVFALTLAEALAAREPAPALPPAAEVRAAVDRAMDYFAHRYWDTFAADFVWMEENWHCLAARAALGHHRHDGYERFCLDYVAFKSRLILDEQSGVQPDFLGGYGFGNVLPPHNTSTAGFGEALAAAMAIEEARGMDLSRHRALMERVLGFLVRQQWDEATCFACARGVTIAGAFSESMSSPQIRIDYVQHAWAALGHGGRALGLLPRPGATP